MHTCIYMHYIHIRTYIHVYLYAYILCVMWCHVHRYKKFKLEKSPPQRLWPCFQIMTFHMHIIQKDEPREKPAPAPLTMFSNHDFLNAHNTERWTPRKARPSAFDHTQRWFQSQQRSVLSKKETGREPWKARPSRVRVPLMLGVCWVCGWGKRWFACMCVSVCLYIGRKRFFRCACVYVCIYVCLIYIYICIYICVCVCIHIYYKMS